MVNVTSVISAQPAIIRNLLEQCTQQTNQDGTVSYFLAHNISSDTMVKLTDEASVRIPGAGYYAKNGENFGWTARFPELEQSSTLVHFVFNDYSNTVR